MKNLKTFAQSQLSKSQMNLIKGGAVKIRCGIFNSKGEMIHQFKVKADTEAAAWQAADVMQSQYEGNAHCVKI